MIGALGNGARLLNGDDTMFFPQTPGEIGNVIAAANLTIDRLTRVYGWEVVSYYITFGTDNREETKITLEIRVEDDFQKNLSYADRVGNGEHYLVYDAMTESFPIRGKLGLTRSRRELEVAAGKMADLTEIRELMKSAAARDFVDGLTVSLADLRRQLAVE